MGKNKLYQGPGSRYHYVSKYKERLYIYSQSKLSLLLAFVAGPHVSVFCHPSAQHPGIFVFHKVFSL